MNKFKRNQVEEAISRVMAETGAKPSPDLLTRLKRLMNLDRALGRKPNNSDPAKSQYAFYSDDAPGKGVEVLFSSYEAFALSMGLRLLEGQWPQGFVVEILRHMRTDLEREHRRILQLDETVLFDKETIRKQTEASFYQATNTQPVFLLIVSDAGVGGQKHSAAPYSKIFRDPLDAFRFQMKEAGRSCTWCELVTPAWNLQKHLTSSLPRQRGRAG